MSTKLTYGDFTFDLPGDHDAREAYLLQYGFAQSLQDSVAGKAKKWREDGKSGAEIDAMLAEAQTTRFNAIVAGTMTHGGSRGPRLQGIESIMHDVAVEKLKAAHVKEKKSWPSGKGSAAQINALVEKYVAKYGDATRAEAERRMVEMAKSIDLADLDVA